MSTSKQRKKITTRGNGESFDFFLARGDSALAFAEDEVIGEVHEASQRKDGTWDVPKFRIFAETRRWNEKAGRYDNFDQKWIDQAVAMQQKRQKDGYLSPVHVKHTASNGNSAPAYAGRFKDAEAGWGEVEGEKKYCMTVTLTDIPDKAFKEDLEAGKLGYRSVEILKPDRPEISSLALLDSEVPYFKFPVARFKRSKDKAAVAFAEGDGGHVAVVYPWGVQFMDPKMQKQKYNADNDEDDKEEKGEKKKGKDDESSDDEEDQKMMAGMPHDSYPPGQNPGGDPMPAPGAGAPEAGAMPGQPPMPPPEMPGMDPMAGGGMGGAMLPPEAVNQIATAVAAQLTQQSMAPSPPPAPIAASEPTDQGVTFQMDPQSAARFAEQSAEIAQLKQARAADLLAADIAQRVNTMSQKFQEHDAAGGGKLIERYDPAALQHFAEVAKTQPAADQDAYWAAAEAACKTTFEEPSAAAFTADTSGAPQSAQKFAEGVEDDGPFARWFGADVENRETFEAAADIYAQQFEEMPASRQESYESQRWGKGKKGWVADQLILLEYTPTS